MNWRRLARCGWHGARTTRRGAVERRQPGTARLTVPRLLIRWEVRNDIRVAFLRLACGIVCWRHLVTLSSVGTEFYAGSRGPSSQLPVESGASLK